MSYSATPKPSTLARDSDFLRSEGAIELVNVGICDPKRRMSGNDRNVFLIARRGRGREEDQLTDLLAYLFQEEDGLKSPWLQSLGFRSRRWTFATQASFEGGRLDLRFDGDGVTVLVESKLGSTTTVDQCRRYIDQLQREGSRRSALVLLTREHEDWPETILEYARTRKVELVQQRWWDVWRFLDARNERLARNFAVMLDHDGMAVPNALAASDWEQFTNTLPALRKLLDEAHPALSRLAPDYSRQLIRVGAGDRSIYSLTYFAGVQIRVGFAAGAADMQRHLRLPGDGLQTLHGAVISSHVFNSTLPPDQQTDRARAAITAGGPYVVGAGWKKFPTRARPVANVLRSDDFHGQVSEAVAFTRATLSHFANVGYLSPALLRSD